MFTLEKEQSQIKISKQNMIRISNYIRPFKYENVLLLLSRFSRVRLCVTPWTVAHQASLSPGFSRLYQSVSQSVQLISRVRLFATP